MVTTRKWRRLLGTAAALAVALVSCSQSVAGASATRRVTAGYVGKPHDSFAGTLAWTAARADVEVVCDRDGRGGIGGICVPFRPNERELSLVVRDRSGHGVGGRVRFGGTPVHGDTDWTFCGAATAIPIPEGASHAVVVLDSLFVRCGGPATAGVVEVDIRCGHR